MGLAPNTVIKVVKTLYGIPESGLHWYLTYIDHHVTRLEMKKAKVDSLLLTKHTKDGTMKYSVRKGTFTESEWTRGQV